MRQQVFQNQVRRLKIFGTKYRIPVHKAQWDWVSAFSAADRGFPQGGGTSRRGSNIPNFPKNCMKLKECGRPSCPLKSTTDILFLPLLEKVGEK